ncbi:MAG: hypothetical protein ACI8X5_002472 [Planctomycetota bacterium]|jgi:hypothetical protein
MKAALLWRLAMGESTLAPLGLDADRRRSGEDSKHTQKEGSLREQES